MKSEHSISSESMAQGLKPNLSSASLAARLKSCPDTSGRFEGIAPQPAHAAPAPPQTAQVGTQALLAMLDFYRRWISPAIHALKPGGCRYLPTCSEYASIAIATHGPLRGVLLASWRLLRCNPFARGGLDNVPPARISRHIPHEPLP